jgi:hypothetical protein
LDEVSLAFDAFEEFVEGGEVDFDLLAGLALERLR